MNLNQLLTKFNPFKKKDPAPIENEEAEAAVVEDIEVIETPTLKKLGKKLTGIGKENWKISEMDKQIVVSLWATGLTPSEVIERARLEHNIVISAGQVNAYSKAEKWQPLIKKIRQETFSDLAAVAGSHKKVRLERGEKIYEKAITKGKLDLALKATEHQRKEMEEQGSNFSLTLNQFNVLSDEELQLKQKEVMSKIKRLSEKQEKKGE